MGVCIRGYLPHVQSQRWLTSVASALNDNLTSCVVKLRKLRSSIQTQEGGKLLKRRMMIACLGLIMLVAATAGPIAMAHTGIYNTHTRSGSVGEGQISVGPYPYHMHYATAGTTVDMTLTRSGSQLVSAGFRGECWDGMGYNYFKMGEGTSGFYSTKDIPKTGIWSPYVWNKGTSNLQSFTQVYRIDI